MAVPSEVRRVQAAIDNKNRKELEWSLWYARMRMSVASARPADVKYWRAVEAQVEAELAPPQPEKVYAPKRRKNTERGLGSVLPPAAPGIRSLAMPKSSSFGSPSGVTRMLLGLRSRCTTQRSPA